jgi:PEP-CTERM motif
MREGLLQTAVWRGVVFLALAICALVTVTSSAHANTMEVAIQVDGGFLVPLSSGTGSISLSGDLAGGGLFTSSINATGFPILSQPQLSTSLLNVQSAPGTHVLDVFITQQGLSFPSGVNSFISSFSAQFTGLNAPSVLEQTFISPFNVLFAGTLLASANFPGVGSTSSTNNTPLLGSPYSETVEYRITTNGPGSVNATINLGPSTSVPEPSTLLLAGFGLGGLLLLVSKRRLIIA